MEDSQSKRLERPHCHDSEEEEHHNQQYGLAVPVVNRLRTFIANIQRHLGKFIRQAQVKTVQRQINVLADISEVHEVSADLLRFTRVDMESLVAERFTCRVICVVHGII